jgi:hypothetical protein
VSDLSDLDAALADAPIQGPSLTGAAGKKCSRHPGWKLDMYADADGQSRVLSAREVCIQCGHVRNPDTARRNRSNRNRGKGTSRDLATYLHAQNVEGMNWPWDVQHPAFRLQSKREARPHSLASQVDLISRIPFGDFLRGLYYVAPGRRLTSGSVTVLLEEWTIERGWVLPAAGRLSNAAGVALLTLTLPEFADLCVGAAA